MLRAGGELRAALPSGKSTHEGEATLASVDSSSPASCVPADTPGVHSRVPPRLGLLILHTRS